MLAEPWSEIVGELGTCLRLLECPEETPRVLGDEMARAAYEAWAKARKSILDVWLFETDSANLQPRIRRLNRDVAAFLRTNPPPDVPQERLHRALDAVESPWPRREENVLRLAWERTYASSAAKARALIDAIEKIGAEPFHAPDPLPPISEDEIHLITWMAIEPEPAGQAADRPHPAGGAA